MSQYLGDKSLAVNLNKVRTPKSGTGYVLGYCAES